MMASEKYIELLKDPRWQRKRLEKLEQAGWRCEYCHNDKVTLNVHHLGYKAGAMPWEYELPELEVLCEPCHEATHEMQSKIKDWIQRLGAWSTRSVFGYTSSYASAILGPRFGKEILVNVKDEAVASGVLDAIKTRQVGGREIGSVEWVQGAADETGCVDPFELFGILNALCGKAYSERKEENPNGTH